MREESTARQIGELLDEGYILERLHVGLWFRAGTIPSALIPILREGDDPHRR